MGCFFGEFASAAAKIGQKNASYLIIGKMFST